MNRQQIAREYRRDHMNGRAYGVVILHEGEVAGWMNELRSPDGWVPGAIAIDSDGKEWIATGGDEYNGAQEWESTGQMEAQA